MNSTYLKNKLHVINLNKNKETFDFLEKIWSLRNLISLNPFLTIQWKSGIPN